VKIAIISKADKSGGGASRVAQNLAEELIEKGHFVHHYHNSTIDKKNEYMRPIFGSFTRFIRKVNTIFRKLGIFGLIPFELPILLYAHKKEHYDIIHFHDISSVISPLTLKYLAKKVPLIWTMHDCSPFTGGCIYPMDCNKYKTHCFPCPQRGYWPIDSYLNLMFIDRWIKANIYKYNNIHLLAPSSWMSDMAMKSKMLLREPQVISNGVNIDIYKPLATSKIMLLKNSIGIDTKQLVLLVLANNLSDMRKGVQYSMDVIRKVSDLNPFVILVGKENKKLEEKLEGISVYTTGYVSDEKKLNEYYNIADIFLNCTLADNQPLVVLETMAAGTTTIGFNTGGIPEMVDQNLTGYLVEQRNILKLEEAVRDSINNKSYITWGKNARKKIEKKYTNKIFLRNHLECYNSLIGDKNNYD
jgi:glycosyltransferase involved in cell wall biosynthesis